MRRREHAVSVQVFGARPWAKWVLAGLAALMVLQHYALWELDGREVEPFNIIMFLGVAGLLSDNGRCTVLAGPVLRLVRGLWTNLIPLATAEVKGLRTGWQIRWADGRNVRRLSLVTAPEFREAVERAVEQARTAPPGSVPRTVQEARQAVPLFLRTAAWERSLALQLSLVALALLAIWLDHPVFLLGAPVIIWLQDRVLSGTTLVLCDGTLWFLGEGGPVYQIPLSSVRSVEPRGRRRVLLELDDLEYPVLKLARYYEGVDALVQLQKALAGEPLFTRQAGAERADHAGGLQGEDGPLRCALCGRPEPGSRATGGVHICERCQHRARYEAQEAGHGLQGREPQPM